MPTISFFKMSDRDCKLCAENVPAGSMRIVNVGGFGGHWHLDCWFAAKLKMGKAKAFKKWENLNKAQKLELEESYDAAVQQAKQTKEEAKAAMVEAKAAKKAETPAEKTKKAAAKGVGTAEKRARG